MRPERLNSRMTRACRFWTTATALLRLGCILVLSSLADAATITVGGWTPIFRGIDLASGQQAATIQREVDQQVLCMRVDLTDPDIRLLTTPHCSGCGLETLSENTSRFLEHHALQVAINGAFYASSPGATDTPLGTPDDVYGLALSEGQLVSWHDDIYKATLMFRTNNEPVYLPTNSPPASTVGFFTAVSGNHALLFQGTNLWSPTPDDLDPRTAIGLSRDRRYLYLLTIDGRQPGWSEGADFHDVGEWLIRFGAWDAINVDGGGSTTMAMANCVGGAVRLNRPSFVEQYGRERIVGHNFGVRAQPLASALLDFNVEAGGSTCLLTWRTEVPGTTKVEYGLGTNYSESITPSPRPVRSHAVTLVGLARNTTYFFRASSIIGGETFTKECQFRTSERVETRMPVELTSVWSYTTNDLTGTSWQKPSYDDTWWTGSGPGLLFVENNGAVGPRNTMLPPEYGQQIPRTYYFRTHFSISGNPAGSSLLFSNYVDDGAVFYLNGIEVHRLRMPARPTAIANSTPASSVPCSGTLQAGDAAGICPDLFAIEGSLATNLVAGDNVLAVEVHNYGFSLDLVFGSAVFVTTPVPVPLTLHLTVEDGMAMFYWNGEGRTLQETPELGAGAVWSDVGGPVTSSPFVTVIGSSRYYRLRD